jgi:hypothetical protein
MEAEMSEDNDTRKQIEEDAKEDLELKDEDADDVRGGVQVPGASKWTPHPLK